MADEMSPFEYDKEVQNLSIALGHLKERFVRANKMYFEASTGHRPAWKRFEPALDVLQGAINDFQSIAKAVRQCPTGLDVTKRKRNSDGLQVSNKPLNRMFLCFQCKENEQRRSSPYFKSAAEVHAHWLQEHESDVVDFLFYVVNRMSCFHCKFTGIYSSLVHHYRENHRENNEPMIIVSHDNPLECAICHGIEKINFDDLIEHFETEHAYLSHVFLVDPIYWSNDTLQQLRIIDAQQSNHQVTSAEASEVKYLICHCDGNKKIPVNGFFAHCKEHVIDAKCSLCPRRLATMGQLLEHNKDIHGLKGTSRAVDEQKRRILINFRRLRFVFGNGLVAMAQNLTATTDNVFGQFEKFVNEWIASECAMETA